MSSDVSNEHNVLYRGCISSSMEDFVKSVFEACDKDNDGYLDRSDLEEVRKQIGLDGNISEILDQFGASSSGKISYEQFCENSAALFADQVASCGSESSPEYCSTDSSEVVVHVPMATAEKGRTKKDDIRKDAPYKSQKFKDNDLEEELKISSERIKEIAESFKLDPHYNPHRKSGGGFEDYLDEKTLAHLEELKIIDTHSSCDKPYIDKPFIEDGDDEDDAPVTARQHVKQRPPVIEDFGDHGGASRPDYLELSKKLHLAALTSYKNEIYELNSRLHQVRGERDDLRRQKSQWHMERQKMQQEFESKLQSQAMRVTELQSVIAELTRKLNTVSGNMIIEEEEEDEECDDDVEDDDDGRSRSDMSDLEHQGSRACSECSCENCDCDHHLDDEGPNQVNFLATTKDITAERTLPLNTSSKKDTKGVSTDDNNDLQQQLHRVLGALESNIELRKQNKTTDADVSNDQQSELDLESNFLEEARNVVGNLDASSKHTDVDVNLMAQLNEIQKQVEALKKDKRQLEKQLNDVNVQGYVYQKGNTGHVEEEFSKLRQENNYLRSKLRKSEQELEDVKASNVAVRGEKDRLKKKNRALQDTVEGRERRQSPVPFVETTSSTTASPVSSHRRSNSTHTDRPVSPVVHQRSASSAAETRQNVPQRSQSLESRPSQNGSPRLQQRSPSEARSSPSHSTRSLPTRASAFAVINSKGYTVSPENSLRRGQHMFESSDLGSSIGDESQRNFLIQALVRNLRGNIPETLLQTLMAYNSIDPVLKHLVNHFVAEVEEKRKEGSIHVERLESRMGHLQSQKDLLQLSLHESKQNAERLSLLCGKYESNSTAWSLALQNTEQLIETYEVMLQLQESEADMFAVNYQAIGVNSNFDTIKSLTSTKSSQSNISIESSNSHMGFEDDEILKSYHNKRKDLETQAKILLHQLDKKYDVTITSTVVTPTTVEQDEISYKSRTSTGSSMNSNCTDTLSKDEEHRLRDYIKRLKTERRTYQGTVCDKLESVHEYCDPPADGSVHSERSERTHDLNMDIETAVLLQDMQALKEERAELKHRIYLLEKEKRALELKLNSREAQEQAYIVHIEHLKSEVKEQMKKRKQLLKDNNRRPTIMEDETLSINSSSTHSGGPSEYPQYSSNEEISNDTLEASRRERKLKQRIQELVETLEKLSKNSEIRHKQTNEYIADLKRANGALVTAYEKAKKRHASRLKKFEQQLVGMADKYQSQVKSLKEQIAVLKETPPSIQPPQTETSL